MPNFERKYRLLLEEIVQTCKEALEDPNCDPRVALRVMSEVVRNRLHDEFPAGAKRL